MNLLLIMLIGFSLSLDAFSLALSYGLMNISNKDILSQSIIVGIFHFFMPIIGKIFGKLLIIMVNVKPKYIVVTIFLFIILSIIKNLKEEDGEYNLNFIGMLLFGFAVSIDSFSIGISLNYLTSNFIICPFIFMMFSFSFTFLGFKIGKYISKKIGFISKILSAVILSVICVYIMLN